MLYNKETSEQIIISKLSDILQEINENNLTKNNAQWLLQAISYNNTIVATPNENIDKILQTIYQTIATKGIIIHNDLYSSEKALQILMNYTQFLEKEKIYYDSTHRSPLF